MTFDSQNLFTTLQRCHSKLQKCYGVRNITAKQQILCEWTVRIVLTIRNVPSCALPHLLSLMLWWYWLNSRITNTPGTPAILKAVLLGTCRWLPANLGHLCVCVMTYLSHHHVLTFADVSVFGLDDCLQELDVLHVAAVGLNASHDVLHDSLGDFVAQRSVVVEQHAQRLNFQQLAWHNTSSSTHTVRNKFHRLISDIHCSLPLDSNNSIQTT